MEEGPATDLEEGIGLRKVLRPSASSPARRVGIRADLMVVKWNDDY